MENNPCGNEGLFFFVYRRIWIGYLEERGLVRG
jgi:hypothetical protein